MSTEKITIDNALLRVVDKTLTYDGESIFTFKTSEQRSVMMKFLGSVMGEIHRLDEIKSYRPATTSMLEHASDQAKIEKIFGRLSVIEMRLDHTLQPNQNDHQEKITSLLGYASDQANEIAALKGRLATMENTAVNQNLYLSNTLKRQITRINEIVDEAEATKARIVALEPARVQTTVLPPKPVKKTGWVVIYKPTQFLNERTIYATEDEARRSVVNEDFCAITRIDWEEPA